MPLQHRLCFGLGHQSQQLLPSMGDRRQPGQGDSNLSSAVAPWPNPDSLSPLTPSGIASKLFAAGEK